jgi:hypothetical protein
MVARKARRSRRLKPVKGSAHDRSLHAGFPVVHHNTVGLLGQATKPRPEARRVETGSGRTEKLQCRATHDRIAGLASRGRGLWQRRGWRMKEDFYLTILPLRGVYLYLCSGGSLVICPTRRDFIYIALGFQGNSSIQTAFSFPYSLGLDFLHCFVENLTSKCMETFMVALISFLWLK